MRVSRNRLVGATFLLVVGIAAGIWWLVRQPAPNRSVEPAADASAGKPGGLEFATPLLLALDPIETRKTEVALHNPGPGSLRIPRAESNCTCTQVLSFPGEIPPGGTAPLVLSSLGTQTGQSRIIIQTNAGAFGLDVMTHVRGNLPDPKQALQDHIATYEGTGYVWLGVLHDLHGHVENCGCSEHALGGLPSILAAETDLRAAGIAYTWLATGDAFDKAPATAAGPLLTDCGIAQAPDAQPFRPAPLAFPVTVRGNAITLPDGKSIDFNLRDGIGVDWIIVTKEGKFVDHWVWIVDARMPPDATVQTKVAAYTARFQSLPNAAATYTETNLSQACKSCHENTYAVWEKSAHSKAITVLKAKHADARQDCLICHTTRPQGELAASPTPSSPPVANVHCQACHPGPNLAAHLTAPKTNPLPTAFTCVQCHTPTVNPDFDQSVVWARIRCRVSSVVAAERMHGR